MRRELCAILLVGVLHIHASPSFAQSTPGPRDACELADAEVGARLAYIDGALAREQVQARLWQDGWLSLFAGVALGQGALAAVTRDGGVRGVAVVGSAKSTLAFVAHLVAPPTAGTAASTLRRAPAPTCEERRAKLRLAESLLRKSAAEERFGRSWIPLAAGGLLNLAGTFILWGGYQRYGAGWFGLGAGLTVSQLRYWTQPHGAIAAWDTYLRAGRHALAASQLSARVPQASWAGVNWYFAAAPAGALVGGTF